ncbi:hypothetical protein BKA93DRAFT_113091 [Sparassis latifolia]
MIVSLAHHDVSPFLVGASSTLLLSAASIHTCFLCSPPRVSPPLPRIRPQTPASPQRTLEQVRPAIRAARVNMLDARWNRRSPSCPSEKTRRSPALCAPQRINITRVIDPLVRIPSRRRLDILALPRSTLATAQTNSSASSPWCRAVLHCRIPAVAVPPRCSKFCYVSSMHLSSRVHQHYTLPRSRVCLRPGFVPDVEH